MNYSRIIPNTIRSIFKNKAPLIWTGAQNFIREFLYVDDAADAYLSIAKNIKITKGSAYNIGSGEKITIGELVVKILDKISTDVKIEYRERTFPEISNQYLDSSKIKNDIGWEAKVKLDEGLSKTIEIYKNIFLYGEGK
jgi:nucleoside-diphosphate-sugar epimerase